MLIVVTLEVKTAAPTDADQSIEIMLCHLKINPVKILVATFTSSINTADRSAGNGRERLSCELHKGQHQLT